MHDRCHRRSKDIPLAEQGFVVRLTVRRFVCGAGLPASGVRRAVLALAGRADARPAAHLGFGTGRMTLLRRVMALPDPQFGTPRVWA
ncbi:hypothetical protein ACICHK_05530 [Streptomyces sp. AHU1]|uniref:hypothetical protein n=1 Tax=Streptomyces sp. AHU1 TaxID=3377215 RepID=UPI003877E497